MCHSWWIYDWSDVVFFCWNTGFSRFCIKPRRVIHQCTVLDVFCWVWLLLSGSTHSYLHDSTSNGLCSTMHSVVFISCVRTESLWGCYYTCRSVSIHTIKAVYTKKQEARKWYMKFIYSFILCQEYVKISQYTREIQYWYHNRMGSGPGSGSLPLAHW